jgi:fucose permease
MSEFDIVSIISLVGFLVLAVGALSAHRLSLKKGVVMALAWAAIFAIVVLFISMIEG